MENLAEARPWVRGKVMSLCSYTQEDEGKESNRGKKRTTISSHRHRFREKGCGLEEDKGCSTNRELDIKLQMFQKLEEILKLFKSSHW